MSTDQLYSETLNGLLGPIPPDSYQPTSLNYQPITNAVVFFPACETLNDQSAKDKLRTHHALSLRCDYLDHPILSGETLYLNRKEAQEIFEEEVGILNTLLTHVLRYETGGIHGVGYAVKKKHLAELNT
jgi:hypothetical protein